MQPPSVLAHASWALIATGIVAAAATLARMAAPPRPRVERDADDCPPPCATPWRAVGAGRYAATFLYRDHPLTAVLSHHSEEVGPCIWLLRYGPESLGTARDLTAVTRSIILAHVGERHETAQRVATRLISTAGGTFVA